MAAILPPLTHPGPEGSSWVPLARFSEADPPKVAEWPDRLQPLFGGACKAREPAPEGHACYTDAFKNTIDLDPLAGQETDLLALLDAGANAVLPVDLPGQPQLHSFVLKTFKDASSEYFVVSYFEAGQGESPVSDFVVLPKGSKDAWQLDEFRLFVGQIRQGRDVLGQLQQEFPERDR